MDDYSVQRLLAATLSGLLLGTFAPGLQAASPVISDTPMAVKNTAKSNIMFTVDTSGGMDVEVLLPTYNSMYYENGVTATNNPYNLNGNFYVFPVPYRTTALGGVAALMLEGDLNSTDTNHWRARNYQYNPQYYNPFKTYKPWPGTDKNGAAFVDATPTAVQYDPYGYALGTVDITRAYSSGNVVGAWTVPQAHSYLSTASPPVDITASGGRYYNSTWYPAVYYTWSDLNANGKFDPGEGVRWEIKNPSVTCTLTDPAAKIPGCGGLPATFPSGRTYTAEMQNFANWFQYSRMPLLTLQGSIGKQLDTLGSANVGMVYLEKDISDVKSAPVTDMAVPANVTSLRNKVYDLNANLNDWRQPIHERMNHVFNYFKQTATVNGVPAPVKYACQQNFNVLATPGYLNENGPGATGFTNYFTGITPPALPTANYDGTVPGSCAAAFSPCAGAVPFTDGYSNTLADWALYIYQQNLRPDLTTGQVPTTPSAHDNNPNLHLNTYVLAPAAVPVLGGSPRFLNAMTVDPYTITPSIAWPQPVFVDQSTVDDLWHASVNGRGVFVNDTDIFGGLTVLLNDIMGRVGAAAAVAVSNANISPGDNFSYASSYNSGNWSGDLQSYSIDLVTGQPSTTPRWVPSAQVQLDTLVNNATRNIATYDGSAGVALQWASLSAARQALLNSPVSPPGLADGASVLAFLRGDRSKEGTVYRTRAHVLGDIINAEPMIVREPMFSYSDNGYRTYQIQYTTTTPRTKMVYQAGNDGMLHAFTASTGAEAWAYVPGMLFDSRLSLYPNTSTLVDLSMRSGFSHLYMVDGTPTEGDVDFLNTYGYYGCSPTPCTPILTSATTDWHAVLVGGLRKGGRGYYALDVTNPAAANDTAVAAKVLWEFPNASTPAAIRANIGYSYGKPIVAKTKAAGWVVLLTSGYNNGTNTGDSGDSALTAPLGYNNATADGQGHLYVLNAKTGALIADIPACKVSPTAPVSPSVVWTCPAASQVGSPASPSGLGQISGWTNNGLVDNTVTQVYGTDLQGYVWRFDFTSATTAGWKAGPLAQLVDASGTPQPITTTPELALVNNQQMVFVGTGQYLGDADVPPVPATAGLASTQVQSMYGLVDDLSTTITPLRSQLVQQTVLSSGASRTVSTNTATATTQKGWYLDLSYAGDPLGERIVTDPAIANTTITFSTNIPSAADPCKPGGSSWLYQLNFATGGQLPASVTSSAATFLGSTLASRPILVGLPNGTVVALIRKSDATTASVSVANAVGGSTGRRVSWREIVQ